MDLSGAEWLEPQYPRPWAVRPAVGAPAEPPTSMLGVLSSLARGQPLEEPRRRRCTKSAVVEVLQVSGSDSEANSASM